MTFIAMELTGYFWRFMLHFTLRYCSFCVWTCIGGVFMVFETLFRQQQDRVLSVPVEKIKPNPNQPRVVFDQVQLEGLAQSIRESGILQPLSLRKLKDGTYQLVAGERRLRAAKLLGMSEVPAIVISADDRQAAILALLENIQREDLDFFEQAEGLSRLTEYWSFTQEETALKLGMAQSTLANKIRLLRLTKDEREQIRKAGLTERHARALLRLENQEDRQQVLKRIIKNKLNVSETDKLITKILNDKHKSKGHTTAIIKDVRIFINTLNKAVKTMERMGINVKTLSTENEDFLEYIVRIPKDSLSQQKLASIK